MTDTDIKRVSRLTAIITQLQTKRLLTATQLADYFGVSVRTIYRDIKTLEQAGIPVLTEEGKGYTLMEGYRVPPIMFTETEANALITAEKLMSTSSAKSLRDAYTSAVGKIRAVLQYTAKEKVELLAQRIAISPVAANTVNQTGDTLARIQAALTSFDVLEIAYCPAPNSGQTTRMVEPFALYYSQQENWLLIAFCRLRNDFRMFRLDRITTLTVPGIHFAPHKLTLAEYLAQKQKNFTTPDIPLS